MNQPNHLNSEFGIPPDEYPFTSEHDIPPAFTLAPAFGVAREHEDPAPEIIPPGAFVSEPRGESLMKKMKKLMLALASAAAVFLLIRPIGLLGSSLSSFLLGTAVPITEEEAAYVPQEDDPSLEISYALLDGDTVRYSYTALTGRPEYASDSGLWKYPVSVAARVEDEHGNTAVPVHDPDIWEHSRDTFAYEIDASGLSGDMVLILTAECDYDGDARMVPARHAVVPLPPAPELSAQLSAAAEGTDSGPAAYSIDYTARFTPDPEDTADYDLTVTSFGINWYDSNGGYRGGRSGISVANDGSLVPELTRDGNSWVYTYSGPADLLSPDDITHFTVELKLRDRKTDLPFTIETERTAIPVTAYDEPVLPVAEIVAYSFYSEMFAGITFSDMEDATAVTLEIWDPNLETLEESRDITEEALSDLRYSTGMFTTDLLYENHEDYYSQEDVPFPMSVDFRVVIEYGGGSTVTYSAETREELNRFEAQYIPENDPWSADQAGSLYFMTLPSVEYPDTEIVIDMPEAVTGPGIISISAEVDGKPVDPSGFTITSSERHATFYGGVDDGKEADVVYREVLIRKPAGTPDDEGHRAYLYITHYLESYDMVYTSAFEFELKSRD